MPTRLVQQKVAGVVGHFCSSSTIPASEVYDEAGIIAITPGSTNPTVTERGLSAMFRMCGRDDQQGIVAGDYIVDVLKGKRSPSCTTRIPTAKVWQTPPPRLS